MISQSQTIQASCVSDTRTSLLRHWLTSIFSDHVFDLIPIIGDASFRRYFRVTTGHIQYIVMDAPPPLENCHPYVSIANAFQSTSVRLPKIIASDVAQGFLLLSDFGDQQLLPILNANSADDLYRAAIDMLIDMQRYTEIPDYTLPYFDDAQYWREFMIFFTWYFQTHQQKNISTDIESELKRYYQLLIDCAHEQPTVLVHRDYHSRNIMLCEDGQLGILDFQDALIGPITYDLVSLLRDCYIAWPQTQVESWAYYFYKNCLQEKNVFLPDFSTFLRWFDWMGLQRHLKCLGIFSRLHYRDQKNGYLKDIPRVLNYAVMICDRYVELSGLKQYLMK